MRHLGLRTVAKEALTVEREDFSGIRDPPVVWVAVTNEGPVNKCGYVNRKGLGGGIKKLDGSLLSARERVEEWDFWHKHRH